MLRRRTDARVFATLVPSGRTLADGAETVEALWGSVTDPLARHRRGDWPVLTPTVRTLE